MEELKELVKHHQPIIAAVIAGACAIIAAVIRRDRSNAQAHEKKPILRLMMLSLVSLVLGAGLLGVERFVLPVDPSGPSLGFHFGENGQFDKIAFANPGAVVLLAGWLFVSAGVIWGFVNLIRLRTAHQKGKELASVPINSGGKSGSIPVVRGVEIPVAKRRT
jgi:hypothetical protein